MITPASTYPAPYGNTTTDVEDAIRRWSNLWMIGQVNFSGLEQREAREALSALVNGGHADLDWVQEIFAEVVERHHADLGIRTYGIPAVPVDVVRHSGTRTIEKVGQA